MRYFLYFRLKYFKTFFVPLKNEDSSYVDDKILQKMIADKLTESSSSEENSIAEKRRFLLSKRARFLISKKNNDNDFETRQITSIASFNDQPKLVWVKPYVAYLCSKYRENSEIKKLCRLTNSVYDM